MMVGFAPFACSNYESLSVIHWCMQKAPLPAQLNQQQHTRQQQYSPMKSCIIDIYRHALAVLLMHEILTI